MEFDYNYNMKEIECIRDVNGLFGFVVLPGFIWLRIFSVIGVH